MADDTIILTGDLLIDTIASLELERVHADRIDLSQVRRFDTAGAWVVVLLEQRLRARGGAPQIIPANQSQEGLIATVRAHLPTNDARAQSAWRVPDQLADIGQTVVSGLRLALQMIGFLGQVMAVILRLLISPRRMRWTSIFHHMQQVGLNAVPIVALMAFLIGVVLAFQGAAQLRQFGAEVFVVDLIAISILRELGILLTAIIVAGRSGSAFTAAVGSMKMREEVDAMRTLGLDPVAVLVVPRVVALIVMLPVLGIIANFSGLIGGALMSWIELGVSPGVFQSRLVSNTDVNHFTVGLIKAPFFALIIGIVGCFNGLQVKGDAESLGRLTSASVVLAIFLVITIDALFSIFFAVLEV